MTSDGRRATLRNQKRQKRELADMYLHGGCVDCGEKDVRVLDFDHVRGTKEFSISKGLRDRVSNVRLVQEIKKCEVRCANCHRKRHVARR